MKVGIITFHASHNYGSMLQAYALQKTVDRLGHDCEIINFRTERQKKFYRPFYLWPAYRNKLKAILFPRLAYSDYKKHKLFEKFLNSRYKLTPSEYSTCEELKSADFNYDAYISGSDQIWNPIPFDHDEAFFLNFVKTGRKIAYAPSFGPSPEIEMLESKRRSIAEHISTYDHVSVREERSALKIADLGLEKPVVTLDPTLLLDSEEWNSISGDSPIISGEYIFLYTPWGHLEMYQKAVEIAQLLNIKLVISMADYFIRFLNNRNIEYHTASGPEEFLNLVKYSKLVISGSFHAVVFSIIFKRPVFAIEGKSDSRIQDILSYTGLTEIATTEPTWETINKFEEQYKSNNSQLDKEIERSLAFLRDALG